MGSFAPYTRARHSCHHCTRRAMARARLRWPRWLGWPRWLWWPRWRQVCDSFASFAAVRPAFGLVWPVLSQSPRRASSDRWRASDHFLRNRWRLSVGSVVLAENFRLRLRCGSRRASSSSALHGMGTVWFFLRNRWRRSVAPDDAHGSPSRRARLGGRVGWPDMWLSELHSGGGGSTTTGVASYPHAYHHVRALGPVASANQNISPWREIT